MGPHSSHRTRISDASSFDEICELCGATDILNGGWGKLAQRCPASDEARKAYDEKAEARHKAWHHRTLMGNIWACADTGDLYFLSHGKYEHKYRTPVTFVRVWLQLSDCRMYLSCDRIKLRFDESISVVGGWA